MDLLSRIAGWLGENEATISAVVGIAVTARGSSFTYKVKVLDVIQVNQAWVPAASTPCASSG